MGQACCADLTSGAQYRNDLKRLNPSSLIKQSENSDIPYQLPVFSVPNLDPKVKMVQRKLGQFQSTTENYQRGVPSEPRKINAEGTIYAGQWKNFQTHGKGKMYFPDKSFYTGFFYRGTPEGEGRLINPDGIYYQGEVRGGLSTGLGILRNQSKGYQYQGLWHDNMPNGQGKQKFDGVSQYKGMFSRGKKQGKGTYKKYGCFEYNGGFKNDLFQGQGKMIQSNGQQYNGHWKQGKFDGFGIYKWPDNSSYQGYYTQGLKNGKGKYTDTSGTIFEGLWQAGKRKGKGKLIKQKQIIEWNWNNDKAIKR